MESCLNCIHAYRKKLFDDIPEFVLICDKDDHYIGYPDNAKKEKCANFSWESLESM